ncbi:hypothetical protein CRE_25716 [Caenorhabditis remanei]|uniref:Uncharacterized protein n=1 Tax=Caenorhabditis remanei TaxID=31234 RepID=E3ML93_CAERE|nr:hypothetical protein CRE_25716 [Caenorhabditis remanei]
MQAKLFMIPWLIDLVLAQRVVPPPHNPAPSAQVLTNDLLVDAHRRHFLEMLRRQQQINDALLLNNALLHPHPLPPLHIPTNPTEPLLPPAPSLFNPFAPQTANQGSTSKLGTYGKDEELETKPDEVAAPESEKDETPSEKDGTVEAPARTDIVKKTLAGVKTVSIQKKGNVAADAIVGIVESEIHPIPSTTTTISPEDLEVVQLFKKLNLSKEETKSIVERVEQVVREKLMSKKLEETTTTTEAPTTVTESTTVVLTTTTPQTTTETLTTTDLVTEEFLEEEEEDYSQATTSAPPQMHIRSEENNLVLLQRNNLKHHPIKLQEKKIQEPLESEEISQGSIKTSLTHLPIFVANEEEDVATQNQKASLHKRILIASQDREKENDRDLLVDFATGAPLDLTEPEVTKSRSAVTDQYSTLPPIPMTSRPVAPPRLNYHERTDFERLASDYRRRLEHTGDINKILQKISENAYISLVERGGRRKLFGN